MPSTSLEKETPFPRSNFVVGDRVRYLGMKSDPAFVDPILKRENHAWTGFTGRVVEICPATVGGKFSQWILVVRPDITTENLKLRNLLDGDLRIGSPEMNFELVA